MDAIKTKNNALSGASALEAFRNDQRVASNADRDGPGGYSSVDARELSCASAIDDIMRRARRAPRCRRFEPRIRGRGRGRGRGRALARQGHRGEDPEPRAASLRVCTRRRRRCARSSTGASSPSSETLDTGVRCASTRRSSRRCFPRWVAPWRCCEGRTGEPEAILEALETRRFAARGRCERDPREARRGTRSYPVPYEDVSKVAHK